jgi:uncharacterized protein DUF6804
MHGTKKTGEGMTSVTSKKSQDIGVPPPPLAQPLDEAVWQAWVLKGRLRDEQGRAARLEVAKWISLAGLLCAAAAGVWSHLTPYDFAIRLLVAAGAVVLMSNACRRRHYAFAILFGILALLYNPVAPVFGFAGEWQRAVLVASALPFVGSLTWRNAKLAPNV